jgi:hypothetical protein
MLNIMKDSKAQHAMKKTKKLSLSRNFGRSLIALVVVALIGGAGISMLVSSHAATPDSTFSLTPATGNYSVGNDVTLNFYENSGSNAVTGASGVITYDSNALNYVGPLSNSGSNFNSAGPTNGDSVNTSTHTGTVTADFFTFSPQMNNQFVASMVFQVKAAGNTNVNFSSSSLVGDASGNSTTPALNGAAVNVAQPSCPNGDTGSYPNCVAPVCPTGDTGSYPNCVSPSCPNGDTGTYPNCVVGKCPSGYTGSYPKCVAPVCPSGDSGTYPVCVAPTCPSNDTGVYPACVPKPSCPSSDTGSYPTCILPIGPITGTDHGTSSGSSSSSNASSAASFTPSGVSTPVSVPDNSVVQVSQPTTIQPTPTTTTKPVSSTGSTTTTTTSVNNPIVRVIYKLNNKIVATEVIAPFSFRLQTNKLLNGKYVLAIMTYYASGKETTSMQNLKIANPESFQQIKLAARHYAAPSALSLLLVLVVLFLLFGRGRLSHLFAKRLAYNNNSLPVDIDLHTPPAPSTAVLTRDHIAVTPLVSHPAERKHTDISTIPTPVQTPGTLYRPVVKDDDSDPK